MAEIVKARDTTSTTERLVAIKRILPHLTDDEQYKAMFMDESRVLAQLDHASVIQAFEIGEIDGTPYIALEYIDGQDGRALFEEARRLGQRIPIGIACFIIARVCAGLHHAHEQTDADGQMLGIVHRDVSLQNILISYDGDVKLTDFGIAVSAENIARTDVGVVKGKFGYMSPEQIKGASLDRRSDVFAVGICLYELLTSERLFSGDNDYKAVERVRLVDVEPPSKWNRQIPSGLEQIVMTALAKQPRERFQSTNDLRRALQQFMADANESVERADLGDYLRSLFADDLATGREPRPAAAGDAITAAQPAAHDAVTGLNAFDDLEPVSSMRLLDPQDRPLTSTAQQDSGMLELPVPKRMETSRSPFRETLRPGAGSSGVSRRSVPPIIPLAESIPASVARRSPAPDPGRRLEMDWDEEEPTTVSQGFAGLAAPPPRSDITRDVQVEENEPESAAISGNVAAPPSSQESPPRTRSIPTLELERARSMFGPGIIAGLFAAAAVALALYLVRDHGVARLRLYIEPKDALVRVDGKLAGAASPIEFTDLAAGVNHDIAVEKPGWSSWSTRLRLRRDTLLELPPIKLERLTPPPSAAVAATNPPLSAAVTHPPPPPTAAVTHPLDRAQTPSSPVIARAPAESKPKPERTKSLPSRAPLESKPKPERAVPIPSFAPPVAAHGGSGTLRVNSRPWSRVTVDGRAVGNTPQMNLQLPAGTHTLVLSNPAFNVTKSLSVTIKANETVTRVLDLSR